MRKPWLITPSTTPRSIYWLPMPAAARTWATRGNTMPPASPTACMASPTAHWTRPGHTDLHPLWQALADETLAADAELPQTGIALDLERRLSAAFIREHSYGTRASTLILVDYNGHSTIIERRFGPMGVFVGETTLTQAPA